MISTVELSNPEGYRKPRATKSQRERAECGRSIEEHVHLLSLDACNDFVEEGKAGVGLVIMDRLCQCGESHRSSVTGEEQSWSLREVGLDLKVKAS